MTRGMSARPRRIADQQQPRPRTAQRLQEREPGEGEVLTVIDDQQTRQIVIADHPDRLGPLDQQTRRVQPILARVHTTHRGLVFAAQRERETPLHMQTLDARRPMPQRRQGRSFTILGDAQLIHAGQHVAQLHDEGGIDAYAGIRITTLAVVPGHGIGQHAVPIIPGEVFAQQRARATWIPART